MTETITRIWDPAEHLQSGEDMAAYLEAAMEIGEASVLAIALEDIARAKSASQLAKEKALGRDRFYSSGS
jgi:probable addiction module antidote protein